MKYLIVFLSLIFMFGCSSQPNSISNTMDYAKTVISGTKATTDQLKERLPEEDFKLGLSIINKVVTHETYKNDDPRVKYLNNIVHVLKKYSSKPYIYNDYKVVLLKAKSFNAYALPGGIIVVHDGIFKKTYNEDQIAAILAHEIGHIENEHFIEDKNVEDYYKISKLALKQTMKDKNLNNSNLEDKLESILSKMTNKILKGYSVEQESEADQTALKLLAKSGYETKPLTDVLKNLEKISHSYAGGNYPKNRVELIKNSDLYSSKVENISFMKSREKRFDNIKYKRY
ncbi:MAG: M48 family metallopeptidase [Campylobacterota bacterium]|nr:M48 family metallopeptidase [Campylobacterota bacterium]